jgi:hypothetical protein
VVKQGRWGTEGLVVRVLDLQILSHIEVGLRMVTAAVLPCHRSDPLDWIELYQIIMEFHQIRVISA